MFHHLILVALLGSSSFQVRQSAQLALENDITSYVTVCLASSNPDPEIATRASRIQELFESGYIPFWLARVMGEAENLPYIDSLPDDYEDRWQIISSCRAMANGNMDKYGQFFKGNYPADTAATAAFFWNKRHEHAEDLRKLYKIMKERSEYWDKNDHHWPPP